MNALTLRNGRQLEDLVVKTKKNEGEAESKKPHSEKTIGESEKSIVLQHHKLKIPFPQRLAKFKLDEQFRKFIEMLKKLYINIPFVEALSQMPF
jgi:hypothetical protein